MKHEPKKGDPRRFTDVNVDCSPDPEDTRTDEEVIKDLIAQSTPGARPPSFNFKKANKPLT